MNSLFWDDFFCNRMIGRSEYIWRREHGNKYRIRRAMACLKP
jgi:hypothetical protein